MARLDLVDGKATKLRVVTCRLSRASNRNTAGSLAIALTCLACSSEPASSTTAPSASVVASQSSAGASSAAMVSSATASAAPAASGASGSGAPDEGIAPRRFRGTFKARKRKVSPQSTAEDDAWKRDDGKASAGPGELEVDLTPHTVRGTVKGPWGTLQINGEPSEGGFAGTLTADDAAPGPHGGFGGVITGKAVGDGFDVEMRVSSGDAVLVRDGSGHVSP